ncbi:acetyl-CoA C-acyltransferase [Marinobacterium sp. D7]|uniref:acetyl-CoA C-acyltransferase n=1 Tax=Marinobacterium ramblicola TaxID=2849041 RepID=UPI001C2CF2C0|nr:acetyl-CoA C-acyltransferase [Marinobacterium ramblicola]MBV1787709.1 acetyl-CoA C-acyltransferase [Marinobacterium ramblicola]
MKLRPTDVVVIDAVRSPLGRSGDGCFRQLNAERLSARVIDALLSRNPELDPFTVEDLIWGCTSQVGEQGGNMARVALLLSSLPQTVPAQTVNRLAASSMTALHLAAQGILSGAGDCYIVGGAECKLRSAITEEPDPTLGRVTARAAANPAAVAELLAHTHAVDRQLQDSYALRSHERARRTLQEGGWESELVPIEGVDAHGYMRLIGGDEWLQEPISQEQLDGCRPLLKMDGGSVTTGNLSAAADGASALLLMSAERAQLSALKPRARIRAMALTACDPAVAGLGAVTAVEKLLDRCNLTLADIDLIELHEESAAQVLAVLKELDLTERLDDRINLCGGAIALGDPLGCSGARICTTLLHQMPRRGANLGLAMTSAGMGQGVATLFERLS